LLLKKQPYVKVSPKASSAFNLGNAPRPWPQNPAYLQGLGTYSPESMAAAFYLSSLCKTARHKDDKPPSPVCQKALAEQWKKSAPTGDDAHRSPHKFQLK
jgi:hypothetical protein